MAHRQICGALALLALAASGDPAGDYPALMPTDQLLAAPALPAHAAGAAEDPSPASAALDDRAGALAARAGAAQSGNDAALQRRAEALRRRAREISEQALDGSCPAGQPSCATPPESD